MAWTEITRRQHDRSKLRYASDSTDMGWEIVAPLLQCGSTVGRPSLDSARIICDGAQYQATPGCQWRMRPKDFPPFTTIQHHFYRWRDSGLLFLINEALVEASRLVERRAAMPTAASIDSQSVRTTESGGPAGYDAGRKISGRKRHIITNTLGNLLDAVVHTADIQHPLGGSEAASLPDRRCTLARLRNYRALPSISSSGQTVSNASSSCSNDGWSNELSHGLTRISNRRAR